jgi:predicted nucleic-acid-binding protein
MTPIFEADRNDNLMSDLAELSLKIDALLQGDRTQTDVQKVLTHLSQLAQIYLASQTLI